MVKMISFPTHDYGIYLKALDDYQNKNYEKAIESFKKVGQPTYFRSLMFEPFIDSLIQLKRYEEVYSWIEELLIHHDELEDDLIIKYLYTMLLDKKYASAGQLIDIIKQSKDVTKKMMHSLTKLKQLSLELIRKEEIERKMALIDFEHQNEQINLIMQLDHINIDQYMSTISLMLNDIQVDPLIKYQLLLAIKKHHSLKQVTYTNILKETYLINLDELEDINESDIFLIPPKLTYEHLKATHENLIIDLEFIKNIWTNDYLMLFPKEMDDYHRITIQLTNKILYLMGETPLIQKLQELF